MRNYKMTGKVIKNFNDGKDNMKFYEIGDTYTADRFRYEELQAKGYLEEGKEVKEMKDYFQTKKDDRKDEEE